MPQISKLHPTLKLCKCGFIGNRSRFYAHMDNARRLLACHGDRLRELYVCHGELPLNEDDPRAASCDQTLVVGLKQSLEAILNSNKQ